MRGVPPHRFSVAPMMDWTDRHCRTFHRLLAPHALLYTEMVTAQAVLRGDRQRLLGFDPSEHLVALQLGGSDPAAMAEAAAIGAAWGYDEININVGCPSDRVQSGRFGACLMAEPQTVAACVAAMRAAVTVPVTVKCRIGIDDRDSYGALLAFVDSVAAAGCCTFIVHARKAWLSGLSPKQNREVPPLRHEVVQQLKADRPELTVVLNGGLADPAQAAALLESVDGVMLGRAAYQTPYVLAELEHRLATPDRPLPERQAVVAALLPYVAEQRARGVPLKGITRHLMGLFHGQPGGRIWRQALSDAPRHPDAGPEFLERALERTRAAARHAADHRRAA